MDKSERPCGQVSDVAARTPLRRPMTPEEAAAAVVFLAPPAVSGIT
ncbi:hypothetical protein [Saccharothrix sp. ALI-22-I]|nr:hypothetical protein [Saccharothrix sp. ALI-22-I]